MSKKEFITNKIMLDLCKEGIPLYDNTTIYFKDSIVQDEKENLFLSVQHEMNDNINQPLTNKAYWKPLKPQQWV